MSMIYFGLDSSELECLDDSQVKEVYRSLNRYGRVIFDTFISKLDEKDRLRVLYETRDSSDIREWIRSGFSPLKFSESFNANNVEAMTTSNPILNKGIDELFNKDAVIARTNLDSVTKSVINDNMDFYTSHYKQATDISYWRNL